MRFLSWLIGHPLPRWPGFPAPLPWWRMAGKRLGAWFGWFAP